MEMNNAQVVLDAGKEVQALLNSSVVGVEVPFLITPGGGVKSLERLLAAPQRTRAVVTARNVEGFTDYIRLHAQPGTTVFAWAGDKSFGGVIDYHGPNDPRWCSHRVVLTLIKTPEWTTWVGKDGVKMGQEEFSEFIEDNLQDVASPAGADLLEVAMELRATKSLNFLSSVRLDNGQTQFKYEENITGSARKGTMEIPSTFTLGISPFEGTCKFEVAARFRYRINDGKLVLFYNLLQPTRVLDAAYLIERQRIADLIKTQQGHVVVLDAKFDSVAPAE